MRSLKIYLKKFWKDCKPQTKREWFKFILNLIDTTVFLIAIFSVSWFYRQGFLEGVKVGQSHCYNLTITDGLGNVLYTTNVNLTKNITKVNVSEFLKNYLNNETTRP